MSTIAIPDRSEAAEYYFTYIDKVPVGDIRDVLERVQNELFDVGADISVPFGIADRLRINQAQIDALEADCDRFNAELPELRSFVLPGGSELAARLHVARATCRRRRARLFTNFTQQERELEHGIFTRRSEGHSAVGKRPRLPHRYRVILRCRQSA